MLYIICLSLMPCWYLNGPQGVAGPGAAAGARPGGLGSAGAPPILKDLKMNIYNEDAEHLARVSVSSSSVSIYIYLIVPIGLVFKSALRPRWSWPGSSTTRRRRCTAARGPPSRCLRRPRPRRPASRARRAGSSTCRRPLGSPFGALSGRFGRRKGLKSEVRQTLLKDRSLPWGFEIEQRPVVELLRVEGSREKTAEEDLSCVCVFFFFLSFLLSSFISQFLGCSWFLARRSIHSEINRIQMQAVYSISYSMRFSMEPLLHIRTEHVYQAIEVHKRRGPGAWASIGSSGDDDRRSRELRGREDGGAGRPRAAFPCPFAHSLLRTPSVSL